MNAKRHAKVVPLLMSGIPVWIGAYALRRGYEFIYKREPNPVTVIWSPHSSFLWRITLSGFITLFWLSIAAHFWEEIEVPLRKYGHRLWIAALLIAIAQAIFIP